jgi:hypothetical protein
MAVHQRFNVGLDTGQFDRGSQRLIDVSGRTARKVAENWNRMRNDRISGGSSGSGPAARGNGSGGLGVQIQDIAVQLQSGTKLATIIAQQGSQMASTFGPGGAVVGAGIAIAGLLVTISDGSNKAVLAAKALGVEFRNSAGDAAGLTKNLEESVKLMKNLSDEHDDLSHASTMGGFKVLGSGIREVGSWLGIGTSKGRKQERRENEIAQRQLMADRQFAEIAIIEMGEKDLEIQRAKADGQEDYAANLQIEEKTRREIARIEGNKAYSPEAKAKMKHTARQAADVEKEGVARKRMEAQVKEQQQAEKDITEEKDKQRKIATEQLEDEGKMNALLHDREVLARTDVDPGLDYEKRQTARAEKQREIDGLAKKMEKDRIEAGKKWQDDANASLINDLEEVALRYADINKAQEEQAVRDKKIGELKLDMADELARRKRAERYEQGQELIDKAEIAGMTPAERAQIKHDKKKSERDIRREAEKEVDHDDLQIRKFDSRGLSAKERKARIADLIRKAEEAKKRDKIEAKFAPDQIREIVKQIAELQAK